MEVTNNTMRVIWMGAMCVPGRTTVVDDKYGDNIRYQQLVESGDMTAGAAPPVDLPVSEDQKRNAARELAQRNAEEERRRQAQRQPPVATKA